MLQTRKSHVIFVNPTTSYEISLSKDQLLAGIEIEEHIVAEVVSSNSIHSLYHPLYAVNICISVIIHIKFLLYLHFIQVQSHDEFMAATPFE